MRCSSIPGIIPGCERPEPDCGCRGACTKRLCFLDSVLENKHRYNTSLRLTLTVRRISRLTPNAFAS